MTLPDIEKQLEPIIEQFYRNYELDMAAVLPPIGTIQDVKEQQRQSNHFWDKRMKETVAALTQLLVEARIDELKRVIAHKNNHHGVWLQKDMNYVDERIAELKQEGTDNEQA